MWQYNTLKSQYLKVYGVRGGAKLWYHVVVLTLAYISILRLVPKTQHTSMIMCLRLWNLDLLYVKIFLYIKSQKHTGLPQQSMILEELWSSKYANDHCSSSFFCLPLQFKIPLSVQPDQQSIECSFKFGVICELKSWFCFAVKDAGDLTVPSLNMPAFNR